MIKTCKASGEQPLLSAFPFNLEEDIWSYCVWGWGSCYRIDAETGAGPAEATKVLLGLEEMAYEDKLRELVCSAWRRERGSPIAAFHYLRGVTGRTEPGSPYFQWKYPALFPVYLSRILMMITVL